MNSFLKSNLVIFNIDIIGKPKWSKFKRVYLFPTITTSLSFFKRRFSVIAPKSQSERLWTCSLQKLFNTKWSPPSPNLLLQPELNCAQKSLLIKAAYIPHLDMIFSQGRQLVKPQFLRIWFFCCSSRLQ
jgi:hypothetical protein